MLSPGAYFNLGLLELFTHKTLKIQTEFEITFLLYGESRWGEERKLVGMIASQLN